VLLVEDDEVIRRTVSDHLLELGMQVRELATGDAFLRAVSEFDPDIILLDLGLPDGDGHDLLFKLRQISSCPVLVMSGRDDRHNRLKSFGLGATDFLSKPFYVEELAARIRLRMRQVAAGSQQIGPMIIDRAAHRVLIAGVPAELTPLEFAILSLLAERAGRVVTRDALAVDLEGFDPPSDRALSVHISHIRKKIGTQSGTHLVTVRGVGYRLDP